MHMLGSNILIMLYMNIWITSVSKVSKRETTAIRSNMASNLSALSMFLFFFSSRRRHTRCSRDWSSDVCSSDLAVGGNLFLAGAGDERFVPQAFAGAVPGGIGHNDVFKVGQIAAHKKQLLDLRFARHEDHLGAAMRSEEHTSELQSRLHLVCRLLLE